MLMWNLVTGAKMIGAAINHRWFHSFDFAVNVEVELKIPEFHLQGSQISIQALDASPQIVGIEIFDVSGRMVLSENTEIDMHTSINIPVLVRGIYLLKISYDKRFETHKLVISGAGFK